jgi:hypothetical protein
VATVLAAGGGIGVSASYIAAPYVARGELVSILTSFALERAAINEFIAAWQLKNLLPNVDSAFHS